MLIYKLLECGSNYSDTTGSSWLYSEDEAANFNANTVNKIDFKKIVKRSICD